MQPLLKSRRREDVAANVALRAELQHGSCWQSRSMRQFEAAAGFVRIDLVENIVSPRGRIVTKHSHRRPASGVRQVAGAGSSSEAV